MRKNGASLYYETGNRNHGPETSCRIVTGAVSAKSGLRRTGGSTRGCRNGGRPWDRSRSCGHGDGMTIKLPIRNSARL